MDKCDKCENMARVTASGYIVAQYLCALHAGQLCERVGDKEGADKFALLVAGEKVLA